MVPVKGDVITGERTGRVFGFPGPENGSTSVMAEPHRVPRRSRGGRARILGASCAYAFCYWTGGSVPTILHSAVMFAKAAAAGWQLRFGIGDKCRRDQRTAEHEQQQGCKTATHRVNYGVRQLRNQ